MLPLPACLPPRQGIAYEGIREGTYYPAVSLYTHRGEQQEPAAVTVNFGDDAWAFPPPHVPGWPAARPACELAGPRPGEGQEAQPQEQPQEQEAGSKAPGDDGAEAKEGDEDGMQLG